MDRIGGAALAVAPAYAQDSVGLNVHLPGDDALDLARDAGVAWVRMDGGSMVRSPDGDAHVPPGSLPAVAR